MNTAVSLSTIFNEKSWPAGAFLDRQDVTQYYHQPYDSIQKIFTFQYDIEPSRGCFELQSPYEAYHQGLQKMTAILLTHPLVQSVSMEERKEMFAEATGLDDMEFINDQL